MTASGLNYSQAARLLRMDVSTVSRSLKDQMFSAEFERRVHKLLSPPKEPVDGLGIDVESWIQGVSENDLRLLRKFVNLFPKAQKIISTALDGPSGKEVS
jgi:hypothetical protein